MVTIVLIVGVVGFGIGAWNLARRAANIRLNLPRNYCHVKMDVCCAGIHLKRVLSGRHGSHFSGPGEAHEGLVEACADLMSDIVHQPR